MRPAGVDTWTLVTQPRGDTRLGQLAEWDTTDLPAGQYELRLIAVDLNNVRLTDSSVCNIAVTLLNEQ